MENLKDSPRPEYFGLREEQAQEMLARLKEQKKKFDKISLQISLAAAIIISTMFLISNFGSGVPVLVTVVMALSTFTFCLVAFGLFWKIGDTVRDKIAFSRGENKKLKKFLDAVENFEKKR